MAVFCRGGGVESVSCIDRSTGEGRSYGALPIVLWEMVYCFYRGWLSGHDAYKSHGGSATKEETPFLSTGKGAL